MTTIAELIVMLQGKDPAQEVESFVVKLTTGDIVMMGISGEIAKSLIPILERLAKGAE